jgi:hypothetical protein
MIVASTLWRWKVAASLYDKRWLCRSLHVTAPLAQFSQQGQSWSALALLDQ